MPSANTKLRRHHQAPLQSVRENVSRFLRDSLLFSTQPRAEALDYYRNAPSGDDSCRLYSITMAENEYYGGE